MFRKFHIDTHTQINLFDDLSKSCEFENITKGRLGGNLACIKDDNLIPIVRTTTVYVKPVQKFLPIHLELIEKIKTSCKANGFESKELEFNNGLIEIYDNQYTKMGFHSDQSLDLKPGSFICIYSCYSDSNPKSHQLRKLIIKKKLAETNAEPESNPESNPESKLNQDKHFDYHEIILTPNSVVIFDTDTNQKYLHKIILGETKNLDQIKWLGITFRSSNQNVVFFNEIPYLLNSGKELVLATETEKKEFYKLRSKENQLDNFTYPFLNYTISPSDLIKPNFNFKDKDTNNHLYLD
jgi:hypothetical protein